MVALRQRVALITGGSRGIGKGIAFGLGREGARVAISYRSNKAAAQNTLRQLQTAGCECFAVEADAADATRSESLVSSVLERYGRLDILVNNVGIFNWGTVAEATIEEWRRVLDSNLLSVFYNSKAALPAMRRQRWGRVINLGAVGAERAFGQATISAYTAAKAAVVAFSRSLALEEAKNGITVNVVNPPNIDDKELTLEEARRMRDARFPVGRPPSAEDVAAAVKFLASESADYITGQVLSVSGGWML
ncbi:MAG TPA: SDR family oxidoreductase [Candidatus Acidoferrales bacterium]|nr:SDR family oxidoreductase [Candidatus Acidoferrales bacterium]